MSRCASVGVTIRLLIDINTSLLCHNMPLDRQSQCASIGYGVVICLVIDINTIVRIHNVPLDRQSKCASIVSRLHLVRFGSGWCPSDRVEVEESFLGRWSAGGQRVVSGHVLGAPSPFWTRLFSFFPAVGARSKNRTADHSHTLSTFQLLQNF